jgi:hypothetical protein
LRLWRRARINIGSVRIRLSGLLIHHMRRPGQSYAELTPGGWRLYVEDLQRANARRRLSATPATAYTYAAMVDPVPYVTATPPPPRAFTQGVGTVFQVAGVSLFIVMMFICCGSALLSKDKAESKDLTRVGWHLPGDAADQPSFSSQRAIAISVPAGVAMGLAVATLGLGLQAENRAAPLGAVIVSAIGLIFWLVELAFAISVLKSLALVLAAIVLALLSLCLLGLSIAARREMVRNPPPIGHELLPADYKIPYSHMHDDPPDVRLARELEQRRQRLAVQQKELEMIEAKLKRTLEQKQSSPNATEERP